MTKLCSVEEVIEDARNGKMFILVDAEQRENEGDLVIPAQMATPDIVNFMAKHGRGLICLALEKKRAEYLKLPLMAASNQSRHQTAFTVSIEAREGISTGISAHDRAHTIAVAIDPEKTAREIASPGHVFPLVAREGGVLVRAGHTEAAVDISRLAGLLPAGVICEIMNEDGTMARMDDLLKFAKKHSLKVTTIADLIAYRLRHDSLIEPVEERAVESLYGGKWKMHIFRNHIDGYEHIALVKGKLSANEPVLVRMHALNLLEDALGVALSEDKTHRSALHQSMKMIDKKNSGVVVLISKNAKQILPKNMEVKKTSAKGNMLPLLEYGVGAQIAVQLGLEKIILLSNTKRHIVALEGYGLEIVEQRTIEVE